MKEKSISKPRPNGNQAHKLVWQPYLEKWKTVFINCRGSCTELPLKISQNFANLEIYKKTSGAPYETIFIKLPDQNTENRMLKGLDSIMGKVCCLPGFNIWSKSSRSLHFKKLKRSRACAIEKGKFNNNEQLPIGKDTKQVDDFTE